MQFIVKYSPELTIKSKPVRKRMSQQLVRNLRRLLKPLDQSCQVVGGWDKLNVQIAVADDQQEECRQRLRLCPGIAYFLEVSEYPLGDMDDVCRHTAAHYLPLLANRSFAVRCKRVGKHDYNSGDVEREVGAYLNVRADNARVQLKNPDVTVRIEIRANSLYVAHQRISGAGGFPAGSLDSALSLISGGFDSTVASYLALRRGLDVHFLFFRLGGREHQVAVQEIALYLWMKFARTQKLKFVTVPFEEVVDEIQRSVDTGYTGVILKRLMLRAAARVNEQLHSSALITGEAVAQVSSQTMANLAVIDQASDVLVFRPLAFMDKTTIIDIAREIGTEEFSRHVPEYCGAVSVKPRTRTRLPAVLEQEQGMDDAVLEAALAAMSIENVDSLAEKAPETPATEPEVLSSLQPGSHVLDIRHPDEQDARPLKLPGMQVSCMPFFELNSRFGELSSDCTYYLYCEQGLMSRLHASYLCDAGHTNIGVYRPSA